MELKLQTVKKLVIQERNRMWIDIQRVTELRLCDTLLETWSIGNEMILDRVKAAETFDELDNVISFAGYRMSLQEWIDSL